MLEEGQKFANALERASEHIAIAELFALLSTVNLLLCQLDIMDAHIDNFFKAYGVE